MDAEFMKAISPVLIIAISLILSAYWIKTLFATLPALFLCLRLFYPDSAALQIAIAVFWTLLVIGNGKVSAYSSPAAARSRAVKRPLVILGILSAGMYFYIAYQDWDVRSLREIGETVLMAAGGGILTGVVAYLFTLYVLFPLIVLEKVEIQTTVLDYYTKIRRRSGEIHYVCFQDSPELYEVQWALFQKFRRRVGAPVTYIKRRYPFGLYSIGRIRVDKAFEGKASNWEINRVSVKKKTIFTITLALTIIAVGFFLLVMGAAWLIAYRKGAL
jgi:hypothetical protein